MSELERQGRFHVSDHIARTDWQELAAEAACGNAERNVDNAIDHDDPHCGEMPEQCPGKPAAKGNLLGELEVEQRRGVVNLPAGTNHDQDGQRVDPMANAHPARMNRPVDSRHWDGFSGHSSPATPISCPIYGGTGLADARTHPFSSSNPSTCGP